MLQQARPPCPAVVSQAGSRPRQATPRANGAPPKAAAPPAAAKRGVNASRWRHIDPVVPFDDAGELQTIADFYGWDSSALPLGEQLITRSQPGVAKPKRLYYVNTGAGRLPARAALRPARARSAHGASGAQACGSCWRRTRAAA